MAPRAAFVLFVAIAGGALAACGDDDGGGGEVEGLPVVEGAPEVVVVATDFAYDPNALRLRAGEPVNVVLESAEGAHDLVVVVPGGTTFTLPLVEEGQSVRGGLTIAEPGTYELFCSVPGHRTEGMEGTVEVS